MKPKANLLLAAIVLTLVTAFVFRSYDLPLTAPSMTVVLLIWYLAALLVRFVFLRGRGPNRKVGLWLVAALAPLSAAQADEGASACAADVLAVRAAAKVSLTVWPATAIQEPKVEWSVTAGELDQRTGETVSWHVPILPATTSAIEATARISGRDGASDTCVVRVANAAGRNMSGGIYSLVSALLLPAEGEKANFGLYTYLLFGEKPATEEAIAAAKTAIRTYVASAGRAAAVRRVQPDERQWNMLYYLVTRKMPPKVENGTDDEQAAWLWDNTDYVRSAHFLRETLKTAPRALYLVVSDHPIGNQKRPPKATVIDLSPMPEAIVGRVVRHYLAEAASGKPVRSNTTYELLLKARTLIEALSRDVPVIAGAASTLVTLVSGGK